MKDKPYDNSRCFVDTNVWLYSFIQSQDADKSLVSKAILKGNDIIISTQIVNEMCVNLIKKAKFSEKKIQGLIVSLYEQYTVLELSKEIQLKASGIRNEYLFSYWDSIVAASALDCEADYLISEDMQDGFELEGKLKIINPYIA